MAEYNINNPAGNGSDQLEITEGIREQFADAMDVPRTGYLLSPEYIAALRLAQGIETYESLAEANAEIGRMGVLFFNSTTNLNEITSSAS
jgi:hypothetical protein